MFGVSSSTRKVNVGDVLFALTEVIRDQQVANGIHPHDPTPTEFFALVVTQLGCGGSLEHLINLLKILSTVTPESDKAVVRSQFKTVAVSLMKVLTSFQEDNKVQRLCLETLGSLIVVQEGSEGLWGSIHALQSLNALLSFIDDERPNIRSIVARSLIDLLRVHKMAGGFAARSYIADFCIEVIKACTRSGYKRSLYLMLFLQNAMALLPEANVVKLSEHVLKLQRCEQPILTAAGITLFSLLYFFYEFYNVCYYNSNFFFSNLQSSEHLTHFFKALRLHFPLNKL